MKIKIQMRKRSRVKEVERYRNEGNKVKGEKRG